LKSTVAHLKVGKTETTLHGNLYFYLRIQISQFYPFESILLVHYVFYSINKLIQRFYGATLGGQVSLTGLEIGPQRAVNKVFIYSAPLWDTAIAFPKVTNPSHSFQIFKVMSARAGSNYPQDIQAVL
jgi:hypothetical protein